MKVVVILQDVTQMILDVERSDTVLSVIEKIPDSEVLLRMEEPILSRVESTEISLFLEIGTKLFFKGQELGEIFVLADYEIAHNDVLHLRISFSCNQEEGYGYPTGVMYRRKPDIITVFLELPNRVRIALEVDRRRLAYELKEKIPDSELIPIVRQIMKPMIPKMKTNTLIEIIIKKELSFRGQILPWGDYLEKYNIENDDVIHLNVDVSWEEVFPSANNSTNSTNLTSPAENYSTDGPKPAGTSIKCNGLSKCAVM